MVFEVVLQQHPTPLIPSCRRVLPPPVLAVALLGYDIAPAFLRDQQRLLLLQVFAGSTISNLPWQPSCQAGRGGPGFQWAKPTAPVTGLGSIPTNIE